MKLLRAAADRNAARQAMLDLEVLCAVAASFGKGSPPVNKLLSALKKQAMGQ